MRRKNPCSPVDVNEVLIELVTPVLRPRQRCRSFIRRSKFDVGRSTFEIDSNANVERRTSNRQTPDPPKRQQQSAEHPSRPWSNERSRHGDSNILIYKAPHSVSFCLARLGRTMPALWWPEQRATEHQPKNIGHFGPNVATWAARTLTPHAASAAPRATPPLQSPAAYPSGQNHLTRPK